jgi:hypothetical protein
MSKSFQLNIPISKIDEEQRVVTGIATSEALDSQGDIVDYEASKKAFSEWGGNIREMHNPVAIGKGIDVQFDDASKQVIVSAKISESADGENAWIKIKEKVLTGFSIGGRVFEVAKDKGVEGANRVLDYALSELSLVDNPACPDATLLMVKSVDGGLQRVEKAGAAVVDGDPRNASAATVAEVSNSTPVKGGTQVPKKVYASDGKTTTAKAEESDMKKSVWDAGVAIALAAELSYLIMNERFDEDGDASQLADLIEAFNRLREFAAKEVSEGDDWVLESQEVIELANKAINLRKGNTVSKKKDELEKTNVIAGEERDHEAEVVTTAEEAGRPVNDTDERAAEAGVDAKGVDEGVTVETEGDAAAEKVEEAVVVEDDAKKPEEVVEEADAKAEDDKEEKKADGATDLLKNVETLLAKLDKGQENAELRKVADSLQKSVGEVVKSIDSLKDRVETLEKQPLPTKAQRFQVVSKGEESEVTDDTATLLKRQDELIANPGDAKPGEMFELAQKLRKANIGETIKIN